MRISKMLVGTVVVATSIGSSVAVYADTSTPSIQMKQQKDNSIIITLEDMPSMPIYGIEVEVTAKEAFTEDIHFEGSNMDAFDIIKVDDANITIYVANDTNLVDVPTIEIGTIKGLTDVEFLTTSRIKIVDGELLEREWTDVQLEYTANEEEKPEPEIPDPEIPLIPLEPAIPVKPKPSVDDTVSENKDNVQVKNHFVDTKEHWAQKEINAMVEKGILKGYADGTFKPNAPITRTEIAVIIDRAFQFEDSDEEVRFSDVIKGKWYTQAITNLYAREIVKGRPDGTFGFGDRVTNEEVIVMLERALKSQNEKLKSQRKYITFVDEEDISNWAKESVKTLYTAMIINGTPEGYLLPRQEVTRAQVAVMVNRILDIIE